MRTWFVRYHDSRVRVASSMSFGKTVRQEDLEGTIALLKECRYNDRF